MQDTEEIKVETKIVFLNKVLVQKFKIDELMTQAPEGYNFELKHISKLFITIIHNLRVDIEEGK